MRDTLLQQIKLMFRTDPASRPHERVYAFERENSSEIRIIALALFFPVVAALAWQAAEPRAHGLVAASIAMIIAFNVLGWLLPWPRLPRWTEGLPPLGTLVASWMLVAAAGGYSTGYIVFILPPIMWIAMYADLAEVVAALGIVYVTAFLPVERWIDVLPSQGDLTARIAGALIATLAMLGIRPLVEELRTQVEASRRATRSLRASQAALAHDLRTPLTSVCGLASLLEQQLHDAHGDELDLDLLHEYARRIGDLGWQAERTIRGVLELANAGEALPGASWFDPQAMLEDLGAELDGVALQTGPLPDQVYGHEPSIRRALCNLLENAARHGRGHSGDGVVHVAVTGEEVPMGWRFTLADDGPGLDPAEAPLLFEPWRRGTGARDGGHGLGLAIVAAIVEQHGGTIRATNASTGGATFTFTLDRAPRLARAEAAAAASGGART